MIDINLIRTDAELVKENIRKKFQDHKLPLVDQVLELDAKRRALIAEGDALRQARNTLSKQVGMLMKEGKKDEAIKVGDEGYFPLCGRCLAKRRGEAEMIKVLKLEHVQKNES